MFTYKYQLVSDEDFNRYKKDQETKQQSISKSKTNPKQDQLIKDRLSDEAEHIVFRSICQAIQEKVQPPFIAIHNFTLDDKRIQLLKRIFPAAGWLTASDAKLKAKEHYSNTSLEYHNLEYDFLIVGAKIGVVLIEVKSSSFGGSKDFIHEKHDLPEEYKKGLRQLKSIDAFLDTLGKCKPVERPSGCVTRILFTPNLKRERWESWISSLTSRQQQDLETKLEGISQLFKEDAMLDGDDDDDDDDDDYDDDDGNKSIYTALKTIFENRTVDTIFQSAFDGYVTVIAGISAMIESPLPSYQIAVGISPTDFSLGRSAQEIFRKIDQRTNQFSDTERNELAQKDYHHASGLKKSNQFESNQKPPIMFLTPEQVDVLKGKNRQIICGEAGTGKTMLLQQKALELLAKEEQVVVITPKMFKDNYKQLLEEKRIDKNIYQIFCWDEFADKLFSGIRVASEKLWTKIKNIEQYAEKNYGLLGWDERKLKLSLKRLREPPLGMPSEINLLLRNFGNSGIAEHADKYFLMKSGGRESFAFKILINTNTQVRKRIRQSLLKHHLIIDDAIGEACNSKLTCLSLLAILADRSSETEPQSKKAERTTWIAYDPCQYFAGVGFRFKEFWLLLQVLSRCDVFSHVNLDHVMRSSVDIYSFIFTDVKGLHFGPPPKIGHNFYSRRPESTIKLFFTAENAWRAIESELQSVLSNLLDENTEANNFVGIVLDSTRLIAIVVKILQARFGQHKVATISDYHLGQKASIVVGHYKEIFSFEWPIVISARCDVSELPMEDQYLVRSRATADLIEFSYLYDSENKPLNNGEDDGAELFSCIGVKYTCEKKVFSTSYKAWNKLLGRLTAVVSSLMFGKDALPAGPVIGIVTDGNLAKDKGKQIVEHLRSKFRRFKTAEISQFNKDNKDVAVFVGNFHDVLSFKWPFLFYVICDSEIAGDQKDRVMRINLAYFKATKAMSSFEFEYRVENKHKKTSKTDS